MEAVQKRWLMTWSLQICGCLGTDCTFVVTMVTGVYLQVGTQCDDKERVQESSPVQHTCLHRSTILGVEDFDPTIHS